MKEKQKIQKITYKTVTGKGRCPWCNNIMVRNDHDNHNRILVKAISNIAFNVKTGQLVVKCNYCKHEVSVPFLKIEKKSLLKSLQFS